MKGYETNEGFMGYVEGKYILFASESDYYEYDDPYDYDFLYEYKGK